MSKYRVTFRCETFVECENADEALDYLDFLDIPESVQIVDACSVENIDDDKDCYYN